MIKSAQILEPQELTRKIFATKDLAVVRRVSLLTRDRCPMQAVCASWIEGQGQMSQGENLAVEKCTPLDRGLVALGGWSSRRAAFGRRDLPVSTVLVTCGDVY